MSRPCQARTREQLEGTFDTAPSWIDESSPMPDNITARHFIVIMFLTLRYRHDISNRSNHLDVNLFDGGVLKISALNVELL